MSTNLSNAFHVDVSDQPASFIGGKNTPGVAIAPSSELL